MEKIVKNLYSVFELPEPKVLVCENSKHCLRAIDQIKGLYKITVNPAFRPRQQLSGLLIQLKDSLDKQIEEQLDESIEEQLFNNLWVPLKKELWNQIKSHLSGRHPQPGILGGLDAYWLAYYKFAQEIGVKFDEQLQLNAYVEYAKICGVLYFYGGFAIVSNRSGELDLHHMYGRLYGEIETTNLPGMRV